MSDNEIKEWIENNTLIRSEIVEIYEIKPAALDAMIARGKIKPFVKKGARTNLYLKKDIENYLKTKNKKWVFKILEGCKICTVI